MAKQSAKKTEEVGNAPGPVNVALRIVGEGMEAPDQLLANPKNWRTHSRDQKNAVLDLMKQVGWVQRVIVNRRTGHLVDGHARVEIALSEHLAEVPVVYIDVSEDEEALLIAALDPLSTLAGIDKERLEDLLKGLDPDGAALKAVLTDMEAELGIGGETKEKDVETILDQAIQAEPGKEMILIMCDSEEDFAELRRVLGLAMVRRGGYRKGSPFDASGVERVVRSGKLLEALGVRP